MNLENPTEMPREGESLEQLGDRLTGQEASQGNETPAESSTESNENGNAPSQEGAPAQPAETQAQPNTPDATNVPFHQHPRWQEMQQQLAESRQREAQITQYLQQIPGYLDSMRQQLTNKEAPIPDWFVELYGNSPKAWQLYQQRESQMYQQMQQSIMQNIYQEAQQREQTATYWNNQVDGEFARLEQSGKKFDREELKNVLLTYRPVGDDGLLDFNRAYEILDAQKKAAQIAAQGVQRKKIADATSPTAGGDSKPKDYATTAELRNKSWHSL